MMADRFFPSFSIIGCGRLGSMLGKHLTEAGYRPAAFYSRRLESARNAALAAAPDADPLPLTADTPWAAASRADLVFITTPDAAIAPVCRDIAEHHGFSENAVVFHCSGALPSTILIPARQHGAAIGSIHPLQSFAASFSGNPFPGIVMAVEGDAPALAAAQDIARNLGARPILLETSGKVFYHAAAVAASNYLVTLMDLALRIMAASGVPAADALDVLLPLIKGTLANIQAVGIPRALTGPIARGDAATVEGHLAALQHLSPGLAERYARLGEDTLPIALAGGSLSPEAARRLRELLGATV